MKKLVDSVYDLKLGTREHEEVIFADGSWERCVICSGTDFESLGGFAQYHRFQCKKCGQQYHEWD